MQYNIKDFEFSWSISRSKIFNECRRKYFLYYYAARGGHDENENEDIKTIHLCKKLLSSDEYFFITLKNSLNKFLYEKIPMNALKSFLLTKLSSDINFMLNGNAFVDHKLPLLSEFYFEDSKISTLYDKLKENFSQSANIIACSDSIRKIQTLSSTNYRQILLPLSTTFLKTKCYFSPIIIYFDNGENHFLELSSTNAEIKSTLHRLYAMQQLKALPNKVYSQYLNIKDGTINSMIDNEQLNISEVLQNISTEIMQMQSYQTLDEYKFIKNTQKCSSCIFRRIC